MSIRLGVIGVALCFLLPGLGVCAYNYDKYRDWDVVEATYTESNCVRQIRRTGGGRTVNTTFTKYCDRTITYQYHGKIYVEKQEHVSVNTRSRRLVHPSNPSHSEEQNTDNYIVSCFSILIGGLLLWGASKIDE